MRTRHVIATTAAALLLTACGGGTDRVTPRPTQTVSSMPTTLLDGSHGCPAAPATPPDTFIDVKGASADHASLYALLFSAYPIPHGKDAKIAWRMTGAGDLTLTATGPDGTTIKPSWMEYHGGSSWQRPGTEWGSGLKFTKPGCWIVHARRGTAEATASLLVG